MWTITKDLIEDGKKVGTSSCNFDETKAALLKYRFRLLDCDGEDYFEGKADDCDSQRAFGPLDDFGRGNAGCTEVQYFQDGYWRPL